MHIFDTNKVPRVVLHFLWTGTHLGGEGTNVPHEPGTAAPPGMAGPAGAASPTRCDRTCPVPVSGPSQVLSRVHNLDEQD
jgi:hypothetical protein